MKLCEAYASYVITRYYTSRDLAPLSELPVDVEDEGEDGDDPAGEQQALAANLTTTMNRNEELEAIFTEELVRSHLANVSSRASQDMSHVSPCFCIYIYTWMGQRHTRTLLWI